MPSVKVVVASAIAAAAATATASFQTNSLKDIKHIVLFMQENRAFDHYYGTMAGVRNFADPNVQVNPNGKSVFQQTTGSPENGVDILQPWHINYLGGSYNNSTQCGAAGSNGWQAVHTAYDKGLGDQWVAGDGADSLAYFVRSDIPVQWGIVEGWTLLDMSQEAILGDTDPNRVMWMSGSVNIPGSPTNPTGSGGYVVDDTITPGCEAPGINCYPFTWKTFPEYLEEAGISWQVWQDFDNFEDNPLAYFVQYQQAANGSALQVKGNSYPGLEAFYGNASAGTLPQVSWIVGPAELSEHPPNEPRDGAWLQQKVLDSIMANPAYKETVLIYSYDEQGGWADHVVPYVAPEGTAGEYVTDPYTPSDGEVPVGPGWRTPRYIVSPWTRGGNVFTEHADHTSDILFVEQWAAANGYNGVFCEAITPWRRAHMSNLVNAFDFANPDYSIPAVQNASYPPNIANVPGDYSGDFDLGQLGSNSGPWVGPSECQAMYANPMPPVPYGSANANQDLSLTVEEGFKRVRGQLTEGRYLTFEFAGLALTNFENNSVILTPATSTHDNIDQRWIIHYADADESSFYLQSASGKEYISGLPSAIQYTSDQANANAFTFTYNPIGATYSLGLISSSDWQNPFSGIITAAIWDIISVIPLEIYSVSYQTGHVSPYLIYDIGLSMFTFNYYTPNANAQNWIALYNASEGGPVNQAYVKAPLARGSAPSTSGTVVIQDPGFAPGNYTAYFLADNGYKWIAPPVSFVVENYGGTLEYKSGSKFTFTYTTNHTNSENWVGIYDASGGGPDNQQHDANSLTWAYAPDSSGSVTISNPGLASGNYKAFFLYDNEYTWLANPIFFTI